METIPFCLREVDRVWAGCQFDRRGREEEIRGEGEGERRRGGEGERERGRDPSKT
jgi:hypothetical protein